MGTEGGTVSAMTTIMTNIGNIVSGVTDMVGDWIGVITDTGNELLLFFLLVPFVGIGIGLLKRLISVR